MQKESFKTPRRISTNSDQLYVGHYWLIPPNLAIDRHIEMDRTEVRLKTKDVEKFTGLPRSTIIYVLGELSKRGFLQRLGRAAGTHYQLIF